MGKREAPAQDLPSILEREVGSSVHCMLSCDVLYASVCFAACADCCQSEAGTVEPLIIASLSV